jgi:hypothetical protein
MSCSRQRERERETFWHLPCPAVKLHCLVGRPARAGCKNSASASIYLLANAKKADFNRNKEKGLCILIIYRALKIYRAFHNVPLDYKHL